MGLDLWCDLVKYFILQSDPAKPERQIVLSIIGIISTFVTYIAVTDFELVEGK